jgi:hypothetical protein
VHEGAVCENNIESDDAVEGQTPETGLITVAAVSEVAAYPDTGTNSMR